MSIGATSSVDLVCRKSIGLLLGFNLSGIQAYGKALGELASMVVISLIKRQSAARTVLAFKGLSPLSFVGDMHLKAGTVGTEGLMLLL